jgi:glycosyltransferase involved in cell wall biosynthesis
MDLYANALAVLFAPVEEDFGLVALEAMSAGKPVITTSDAGGPCELVDHGRTGFVCAPDPAALGEHAARLARDRRLARSMGRRGRARAAEISWARVSTAIIEGLGE